LTQGVDLKSDFCYNDLINFKKIKLTQKIMKKFLSYVLGIVALLALAAPAFAELQTTPDLDVEGVKVTPLDGSVKVEWDAVNYSAGTLKGYVIWYDTKPAAENGDSYALTAPETGDLGNVTTYTVTGLTNGTKYYFAVTAVDTNGVESQNWSLPGDVATTPTADAGGGDDTEPPQVTNAEAVDKEDVKVTFSEEVVLPALNPESAFVVQNTDTFEDLVVKSAELDATDTTKKTVLLATDPQTKDANYKLTVGIDVQDKAGNPIRSDSSATAPFTGSDSSKVLADTTGVEVATAEVVDNTHVLVNFNEKVVLGIDPTKNFKIVNKTDAADILNVAEVILGKNTLGADDAAAVLTTGEQKGVTYVVTVVGVKDAAGNDVSTTKNTAEFAGVPVAGSGTTETPSTSPKDVAKIIVNKIFEAEKYDVKLSWTIPVENAGKVAEQLLYRSADSKTFDKETSLLTTDKEYTVKGMDPGTYWFKLTQKDMAGVETVGTLIKVYLPKTGPGMIGLLLGSIALGKFVSKKKK